MYLEIISQVRPSSPICVMPTRQAIVTHVQSYQWMTQYVSERSAVQANISLKFHSITFASE